MPSLPGIVALVEDDASLLRALTRVLVAHGYRVVSYTSAERYLAESGALDISCAIIDVHLGGPLTGLDLGEAIARSAHPVPIVFMSGSWDSTTQQRALEIGHLAVLEKPFATADLVKALVGLAAPGSTGDA